MKKGALELSITAIVVLIIAITVLGFAIFFIKSLFSSGQEILTGQLEKVREQLKSEFASEGISAGFSIGKDIRSSFGKPVDFALGISNTEQIRYCYKVSIKCVGAADSDQCDDQPEVFGVDDSNAPGGPWFKGFKTISAEANDVTIIPMKMQVPPIMQKGTFQMRLEVLKEAGDSTATPPTSVANEGGSCNGIEYPTTFTTVPFFITVE